MSKFNVGDVVKVSGNSYEAIDVLGMVGTVIEGDPMGYGDYKVRLDEFEYECEGYYHGFFAHDMTLAKLPYTKITEKLYKNKIKEIKDGYIYF
jgi:hypothetical protein